MIVAREDITRPYTDGYGAGMIAGSYRWSTVRYNIANKSDDAGKNLAAVANAYRGCGGHD